MRKEFILLMLVCLITGCKKQQFTIVPESEYTDESGRALSHTKKHTSEVATSWFHLLSRLTRVTPYVPPPTARIFAYSGMALYESVVPGMPSYQSMYTYLTGNTIEYDDRKNYYWPATANAALARIATRVIGNYTTVPSASIQQLENHFNTQFQSLISAEQLQLSKDFGRYVADQIYNWSVTDGTLTSTGSIATCPPYILLGLPGSWVPTPPSFFPASGACQGLLRTFIPGVVNINMATQPPSYSTVPGSAFYNMANETFQLRNTVSTADSLIVEAWRDRLGLNYNTPSHIIKLATLIVDKENLDLEKAAVLYAQMGMANFDAIASAVNSKFHYSIMRPITYIRGVMGQTGWNTIYPTPQHPAYPAVAPAAAGALVEILERNFGTTYSFVDSTQHALYGSWNYNSFNSMLTDVGKSRTHSGLNYSISVLEGMRQGRRTGEMVYMLPFKKL